jgi:hypothetical protein
MHTPSRHFVSASRIRRAPLPAIRAARDIRMVFTPWLLRAHIASDSDITFTVYRRRRYDAARCFFITAARHIPMLLFAGAECRRFIDA